MPSFSFSTRKAAFAHSKNEKPQENIKNLETFLCRCLRFGGGCFALNKYGDKVF